MIRKRGETKKILSNNIDIYQDGYIEIEREEEFKEYLKNHKHKNGKLKWS
ncbi:MAG: hypothetical protein L3J50_10430 [Emcibacter sp.]|nr:hypothetical protein [Emcibacter sp.]